MSIFTMDSVEATSSSATADSVVTLDPTSSDDPVMACSATSD